MAIKKLIVAVIGAGTMGQGIAQLALQAGHQVILVDQSSEQLSGAQVSLDALFTKFVDKQKVTQQNKDDWLNALTLSDSIGDLSRAKLVIEAIVERLGIKQSVFTDLESIVSNDTLLATNTSSLSVTAIGACLQHPERFIGLHFFNPPGVMPLVEVIDALQTNTDTIQTCMDLMRSWGKSPVRCKNTPGFIVNRVARPFYIESFRLIENQITTPAGLDASIRSAGFKMGPCELTDFIGQDINFAVSCSLFDSLFYPAHLRPSYVQGGLVEAGFLGRKSGKGFYDYYQDSNTHQNTNNGADSLPKTSADTRIGTLPFIKYGKHAWAQQQLSHSVSTQNAAVDNTIDIKMATEAAHLERLIGILENNIHLYASDGRTAAEWGTSLGVPVILADIKHPNKKAAIVAIAACPQAQKLMAGQLPVSFGAIQWMQVLDCPGLINLRVISMIINEAVICTTQGIATPEGIDAALKGGVNYPLGAFEWLDFIGVEGVVGTLEALRRMYGSSCYVVPRMLNFPQQLDRP